MKEYSEKFRRQRKFLLIAPAVIVLLLTTIFVALGGGKGTVGPNPVVPEGVNTNLPAAHLKEDKNIDKLAMYKQAERDSIALLEKLKRQGISIPGRGDSVSRYQPVMEAKAQKVDQQLSELQKVLASGTAQQNRYVPGGWTSPDRWAPLNGRTTPTPAYREGLGAGTDVERLERMMKVMKEQTGSNPEMQQLNTVLDKLLIAQHPEVIADTGRRNKEAAGPAAMLVQAVAAGDTITVSGGGASKWSRFHDLDNSGGHESSMPSMIEAIVPEAQTLVNGELLRIELTTDLMIKGVRVPKGTPLYGSVKLNNERLQVTIRSVRYGKEVYPVNLEVLDQDGMAGIYEPGSMTREVMKESAAEGLGSVAPTMADPGIGLQAASAGIQLARSLSSRKVRLVRVNVPAGYRVFLQDLSSHK